MPNCHIKIDNTEIERVKEFNLLGIKISEHMTWKSHTDMISNKISRISGILNKMKHFLPLSVKLNIYNGLVLPHLHYGILLWGFDINRLTKIQKNIIRIITNSKYNSHTEPLFKQLNLLKLKDIFTIQQYKFFHKYLSQDLPDYFHLHFSIFITGLILITLDITLICLYLE